MADQQQLDLLRQGVDTWNTWRTQHIEVHLNLSDADLSDANLSYADLSDADLSQARTAWTIFGNLDLRTVKGLETLDQIGPSTIGTDTLMRSEGDIPDVFLRRAGLSDTFITYARS